MKYAQLVVGPAGVGKVIQHNKNPIHFLIKFLVHLLQSNDRAL